MHGCTSDDYIIACQLGYFKELLETPQPELNIELRFKESFSQVIDFECENITPCFATVSNNFKYCFESDKTASRLWEQELKIQFAKSALKAPICEWQNLNLYAFVHNTDNLDGDLSYFIRVKWHVSKKNLRFFYIKDWAKSINHSLLPENLKKIASQPHFVKSKTKKNYYKIVPKRGIVLSRAICVWFSNVIIEENPNVAGCTDFCYVCEKDNATAAKKWFTDRGFDICDTMTDSWMIDQIVKKMAAEFSTECQICYNPECKWEYLACSECRICFDCYFKINKNKSFNEVKCCTNCSTQIDLVELFCCLCKTYNIPSAAQLHETPDDIDIFNQVKQQAAAIFPQFARIKCLYCASKNVDAISDLGIYKCNDCGKVSCPTCDLDTVPSGHHECMCVVSRCPQCNVLIEKTEGCNHITCSICNCEFTYRSNTFIDNFFFDTSVFFGQLRLAIDATFEDVMMKLSLIGNNRDLISENLANCALQLVFS